VGTEKMATAQVTQSQQVIHLQILSSRLNFETASEESKRKIVSSHSYSTERGAQAEGVENRVLRIGC
jgi:hypothetical protein